MHPDLVRSPRLNLNVQKREPLVTLAHAVKRERGSASANNSHARAVARVARDGLVNASSILLDATMNERDVGFENFTTAKLIRQILMRGFGLGDDDQAGGIFIQAMNNAGTNCAAAS